MLAIINFFSHFLLVRGRKGVAGSDLPGRQWSQERSAIEIPDVKGSGGY